MTPKVSFLVLDYNKPTETCLCLGSIINHFKNVDKEIILLSNGGDQDHCSTLYNNNFVDILLMNKRNTGCGNGTEQLFKASSCEWAFYVQNDQWFFRDFPADRINYYIEFLKQNPDYLCIDIAGAQGGQNNYSERAHFINVDRYLSIPRGKRGEIGGPGPFNFNVYSEQKVQEFCKQSNLKIYHDTPYVRDNGKWSIREIGDGIYKHRCDTKELYVVKTPTYKTAVYPPLNENEWDLVLAGKWVGGTIPDQWKQHSFKVWD